MRCKPGDLALVISHGRDPLCPPLIGTLVRVTRLDCDFRDHWETDPPIYDARDGMLVVVDDTILRPIRDPGDDAQDELLRPLPQEVTA